MNKFLFLFILINIHIANCSGVKKVDLKQLAIWILININKKKNLFILLYF